MYTILEIIVIDTSGMSENISDATWTPPGVLLSQPNNLTKSKV